MRKLWLVLLMLVGCSNLTGPQRVALCKSQCPGAERLALRACEEIKKPALYEACMIAAESVSETCEAACAAIPND